MNIKPPLHYLFLSFLRFVLFCFLRRVIAPGNRVSKGKRGRSSLYSWKEYEEIWFHPIYGLREK